MVSSKNELSSLETVNEIQYRRVESLGQPRQTVMSELNVDIIGVFIAKKGP